MIIWHSVTLPRAGGNIHKCTETLKLACVFWQKGLVKKTSNSSPGRPKHHIQILKLNKNQSEAKKYGLYFFTRPDGRH